MKNIVKIGLFFLILTIFPLKQVQAQSAESIKLFSTNVFVNKSGVVTVIEEITYDFGNNKRHGIFRDIKTTFENKDGVKFKTPINIINVTDTQGKPLTYTTTQKSDATSIKIGDANIEVTGVHTYIIDYEVKGAVEGFSDHDEVYWNVTGNAWEVPIEQVAVTVHVPEEIPNDSLKAICYTGSEGSTQQNCSFRLGNVNAVDYAANKILNSGEGLTVALSFDKGFVTLLPKEAVSTFKPSNTQRALIFLLGMVWYVLFPIGVVLYYFHKGRDPKAMYQSLPALFEAPEDPKTNRRLTPSEVGTIFDEVAEDKDITATIVDLAIRGYLKIEETNKDNLIEKFTNKNNFILKKTEDYKTKDKFTLTTFETKLLDALFGSNTETTTKELKTSFAAEASKLKKMLYTDAVNNGFFPHNPENIRNFWIALGIFSLFTVNIPFGIASIALAKAMPRKTTKGVKVKTDAAGLKKFLTSQEAQLEYQEMNWFMFEKLLPYAITFGVTQVWAKRFEHLHDLPQNTWYSGSSTFSTIVLADALTGFNTAVSTIATPTRSSSGFSSGFSGGSSGGGSGGGGGGGSW